MPNHEVINDPRLEPTDIEIMAEDLQEKDREIERLKMKLDTAAQCIDACRQILLSYNKESETAKTAENVLTFIKS